jgi:hypothetical protein
MSTTSGLLRFSYVGRFSKFYKIALATVIKASSGQGKNQFIVQQLTKAGYFLHLTLKESPIGLMERMR